jgi:hypothetical protein
VLAETLASLKTSEEAAAANAENADDEATLSDEETNGPKTRRCRYT